MRYRYLNNQSNSRVCEGGGGDQAFGEPADQYLDTTVGMWIPLRKKPTGTQVSAHPQKNNLEGGHKQTHIDQKYFWRPIKEALTTALVPGYLYMKLWRTENPGRLPGEICQPAQCEI